MLELLTTDCLEKRIDDCLRTLRCLLNDFTSTWLPRLLVRQLRGGSLVPDG